MCTLSTGYQSTRSCSFRRATRRARPAVISAQKCSARRGDLVLPGAGVSASAVILALLGSLLLSRCIDAALQVPHLLRGLPCAGKQRCSTAARLGLFVSTMLKKPFKVSHGPKPCCCQLQAACYFEAAQCACTVFVLKVKGAVLRPSSCCALCAFALRHCYLQADGAGRDAHRQTCVARHTVRVQAVAACLETRQRWACTVLKAGLRGAVSAHGAGGTAVCAHTAGPPRFSSAAAGLPAGRSDCVRVLLQR